MANLPIKDGLGDDRFLAATGAGTDVDPFVVKHQFDNPAGAATAANQATANTTLNDLRVRIGDIDDAPANSGDGTVIAVLKAIRDKLFGTVAVSGSVAVSNLPATQPVSGTVGVNNFPATQPVSGTVAVSNLPATQPVSGTVAVSNLPATQPVSVVSLPLPTDAATDALQADANALLTSVDGKLPALDGGRVPVVLPPGGGGLTDAELRASPVPVTGSLALDADGLATDDRLDHLIQSLSWLSQCVDIQSGGIYSGSAPALRMAWQGAATISNVNGLIQLNTLVNQVQMGGIPANYDQYYSAYASESALLNRIFT